jgi:hypothetical protein
MTIQVDYESVNPWDDHYKEFDQYLSAPAKRIFNRERVIKGWENPSEYSPRLIIYKISDLNSKLLRDISDLYYLQLIN